MAALRPLAHAATACLLAVAVAAGCASAGIGAGGFNLISVDDEWKMRDDLRRQVEAKYRVVHDRSAEAYLNRIGRQIAGRTELGDRRWDFGIIQDDKINAFNLPGGLVYVHTGLLAAAERLDQLTGVMAHEIGHGAARHGTQLMTRAYGLEVIAAIALGKDPSATQRVLAEVVGTGVLTRYSREAEREADRLGVGFAHAAGFDPQGMPDFFRVLAARRTRDPSAVERFFASHPLDADRIAATESEIAQLPAKRSLVSDTADYRRFRARWR